MSDNLLYFINSKTRNGVDLYYLLYYIKIYPVSHLAENTILQFLLVKVLSEATELLARAHRKLCL